MTGRSPWAIGMANEQEIAMNFYPYINGIPGPACASYWSATKYLSDFARAGDVTTISKRFPG